ncbi:DUF6123 family protein [Thalassobacillus pellis]|uniref:DUF6123 family protein n=1 Tax=Thalassobacillus pellis TaxID=748008 RepID=UPI00195F4D02|nr:DUF6123 family protein [Thalassobacillus pellis]MBM7552519.1 hypothetical protein [Thalassobacillus pellis]
MKQTYTLAYYLEDLWSKGFKLSDEDVVFIYFGMNSTNAPVWKVILALKATLQFQHKFDGSFYMSVLELITREKIDTRRKAWCALETKGLSKKYLDREIGSIRGDYNRIKEHK